MIKHRCLSICAWVVIFSISEGCSNSKPDAVRSESPQNEKNTNPRRGGQEGDPAPATGADANPKSMDPDQRAALKCDDLSFAQVIQSANVPYRGQAGRAFSTEYTVVVQSTLNFSGNTQALTTQSTFNLISANPPNAADKAQRELVKVTGSRQAIISVSEGMPCGVIGVSRIVETTGDHASTIEFTPSLPYLVSPNMTRERFGTEFGVARTFDNLRLTVVSTTNSKLTPGATAVGSVTITPINPQARFNDTAGQSVAVDADYAYRIEFNFGDFETVTNFGLYKVATYYVAGGQFRLINTETGVQEAPFINYRAK